MTYKSFLQIKEYCNPIPIRGQPGQVQYTDIRDCTKLHKWRANGKCKTWKRDTARFQLPIKHGLYDYAYITNENAHLFIVDET